jgi:hypothetical protein
VKANNYILLLILIEILSTQFLIAQDQLYLTIDIAMDEGTIEQYLDSIQVQTNTVFVYSDIIEPEKEINVNSGNYVLKELLDSIFVDQQVLYVPKDNLIILSPQTGENVVDDRIIVEGKVFTRRDIPVPFATVFIENESFGTISNAEGVFRIVLPEEYLDDSLTVSSMGYESVKVPPELYLKKDLEIKMRTNSIHFKDVIVRPENPGYLVQESYNKRKQNSPDKSRVMNAFFRESSKQNEEYIALSEALVQINKVNYASSAVDQIKLIKGRNGTNINQTELVNLVVEGGLYNGLRLDVAKYGSYFYGEEALKECEFKRLKTVFYRNKQTYVVGFKPKSGLNYPGYSGKLYIDAESLALVRAEFELSEDGIKYARSLLVKKTPRKFKAKPVYARYEVEYRYYDNYWNLHYARSDFGIKVKKVRGKEHKGFSCDFTSTSEFVITGVSDSTVKRIPFKEVAKPNDVLVRQIKNTSKSFWYNDNIIIPEEPLMSTIEKLQQQGTLPKEDSLITKED